MTITTKRLVAVPVQLAMAGAMDADTLVEAAAMDASVTEAAVTEVEAATTTTRGVIILRCRVRMERATRGTRPGARRWAVMRNVILEGAERSEAGVANGRGEWEEFLEGQGINSTAET